MYTVYRLENIVTKKNYIGMTSLKPHKRWCSGYAGKMKEAIDAFPLDLCWKKHIEFQTTNREQALELESELMKWYDSIENGYNMSAYDSSHYKKTEEHRKKISESMTGIIFTEEHRKHMSEARIGIIFTEEHRKHISESTPKKPVLQFSKSGEFIAEYPSTKEAERKTGCYQGNICNCCKGKIKSCGGYIWRYKD